MLVVSPSSSVDEKPAAIIHRATRLVDMAARHHLYPMTCLRRALVLQRILAERGVSTQLQIGVRKIGEEIDAHAWLEYNKVKIDEVEREDSHFTTLISPQESE